ncbi:RGS domain-containing protein [Spinellus fusiger]|nr:RGS domain-containing protein [Spinellus fusiger]
MTCPLPPSLEDILDDTDSYLFQAFSSFLQQSYCHENLVFWLSVQKYKDDASVFHSLDSFVLHQRSESEAYQYTILQQNCHEILNAHIYPNAPQEINIPCDIRQDILTHVQLNQYPSTLFCAAAQAVLELMRANSFVPWIAESGYFCIPAHYPLSASLSFPDRWQLKQWIRYSRTSFSSLGSVNNAEENISFDSLQPMASSLVCKSMFKRMKCTLGLSKPLEMSVPKSKVSADSPRFMWAVWKKAQR